MCEKPTINGQYGYSWDGKDVGIYPPNAPDMADGDALLFDGPGRCGYGCDSHCHHFRVVVNSGLHYLLVRHGGGDERIELGSSRGAIEAMRSLNSDGLYWMLQAFYHAMSRAVRDAKLRLTEVWRTAAAEGRIKTRKVRNAASVRVWIECSDKAGGK